MGSGWKLDGSEELSVEGNVVKCGTASGSSAFNALWVEEGGATGGKHYWKFNCLQVGEGLFVGISDEAKLQKGWAGKGLLYGGNLSNGGAGLRIGFGPTLCDGDIVGCFVDASGDHLKVYFDVNNRPLGMAFDVPKNCLGPFFPLVHFSGGGAVTVQRCNETPTELTFQDEKFEGPEGLWAVTSPAEYKDTTLNLARSQPHEYRARFQCRGGNSVRFNLLFDEKQKGWQCGPMASTFMLGPPEEATFKELFNKIELLEEENCILLVRGAGMSVHWARKSAAQEPVTEDPFA